MPRQSQKQARPRFTSTLQKTEVIIHVYDLLPPGRLSATLWFLGTSLLHSGIVINGKEYAYGGHDKPGVSGVYWTKPKAEPPGGTFRCEILQGFTLSDQTEVEAILRRASEEFLGTSYNLLTKNCNHFTQYLCQKLTGRSGPGWLNRAASIGVALPCVVPREWIEPPDFDTADGELMDEEEQERADERSRMLRRSADQAQPWKRKDRNHSNDRWNSDEERRRGGSGKGKGKAAARDLSGGRLPAAERALASRT